MSTFSVSGLASGIDTSSLIQQLMQLERQPIVRLQERQNLLRTKMDAWRDVNRRLFNLQNRAADLCRQSLYLQNKAESGDSSVFTATAAASAAPGTYQVEILSLARAHSIAGFQAAEISGQPEADSRTLLGLSGLLEINGREVEVTATDSLADICKRINETDEIGVRASIVDQRLVITRQETGAAEIALTENELSRALGLHVETEPGAGTYRLNTIQEASDARIKINNLEITRSTNRIDDVLEGVVLNLLRESDGPVSLVVERDHEQVIKAVEDFVEQYNATYQYIKSVSSYDSTTGQAGVLYGESALTRLLMSLRQVVTGTVISGGSYRTLADLGIATAAYKSGHAEGTLLLDKEKLRTALVEDPEAVMRLLGAQKINVAPGAAVTASSQLDENYPAGSIVDGDILSTRWGVGNGWTNALTDCFDDPETDAFADTGVWVRLDFRGEGGSPVKQLIDQVNIYTLDSSLYPAAEYGIRDYDVQYWDGEQWQTLLQVRGNTQGVRTHRFDPVSTEAIRIKVYASNDTAASGEAAARILEVEVMAKSDGAATRLADLLRPYTLTGTGLIDARRQGAEREIRDLNRRIENMERRLELREEALRRQFLAMEKAVGQMTSQGHWLELQLSSLSSLNIANYRK